MARGGAARELPPDDDKSSKVKIGPSIPRELDEEVRYAVYLRGHDDNLSRFVTEAMTILLMRYRRQYNGGRPYRPPKGGIKLKTGRPMKPVPPR